MAWGGGVWYSVVQCGVVWCGVVWCGVVWCGVVWRAVFIMFMESSENLSNRRRLPFYLDSLSIA